jgi:acyl carrier protein
MWPFTMAVISREQIEEAIRNVLIAELELDADMVSAHGADTPLLGRGIGLDSIDALTLIAALEKQFDLEVDDEELTVQLFKSIGTLADFIATKSKERNVLEAETAR